MARSPDRLTPAQFVLYTRMGLFTHDREQVRGFLLLWKHLDRKQRRQALHSAWVEVQGRFSYRYRLILTRTSFNVEIRQGGRPISWACAETPWYIPRGDHLLAQLLWLKHRELQFLQIANFKSAY